MKLILLLLLSTLSVSNDWQRGTSPNFSWIRNHRIIGSSSSHGAEDIIYLEFAHGEILAIRADTSSMGPILLVKKMHRRGYYFE